MTDSQTDGQTDRQTDWHTQIDVQTNCRTNRRHTQRPVDRYTETCKQIPKLICRNTNTGRGINKQTLRVVRDRIPKIALITETLSRPAVTAVQVKC